MEMCAGSMIRVNEIEGARVEMYMREVYFHRRCMRILTLFQTDRSAVNNSSKRFVRCLHHRH